MKAPIDNVDFGKTASDYLMHRAGFPDSLFVRLKEAGVGTKNENVVDLHNSQPGYRNGHQGPGCFK